MTKREFLNSWPRIGFAPFLGALVLAGCGSADEISATTPQPTVSKETEDQAEGLVTRFVGDLAAGKDEDIKGITSSELQKKMGGSSAKWLEGPDRTFVGGTDSQFDSVENISQGKKLVVHAHFQGKDGKSYRTNFTFLVQGKNLTLNDVLAPSSGTMPTTKGGSQKKGP